MATVFCVTSFAADEPAADTVLRVNGIKENGDIAKVEDYKVFDDGWNAAMNLATSRSKMREQGFIRVEVVLYKDWTATDGEFTDEWDNGPGFNWDAIYFKDDVRITLDLNGHTVDRGLTEAELNGEVMYIEEDADIVIKNGTIKGGFSNNGAGGIQVEGGSKLLLQNVNVINNSVEDDNGAAIALYDGAKLTMIGGSIKNNSVIFDGDDTTRGTVYVEESTAIYGEVTAATDIDDVEFDIANEVNVIKGTLNGRAETAGIQRIAVDDKELWIYYEDKVNIGDIMVDVIEALNASAYTYLTFSRLARSNNAIVFDITSNLQEPIKSIQDIEEESK
jgi:hypothetical protein